MNAPKPTLLERITEVLRVFEGPFQSASVFANLNGVLRLAGLIGSVVLLLVIMARLQSLARPESSVAIINLLMIAAAAFAVGALVGFVLSAFGDEKQTFGNITATINGLIGGFALGDLGKDDSVVRRLFHSLAASAGVEGAGLVGSVVAFFGILGFVCMYVNKQYLLNPAASRLQSFDTQSERLVTVTRGIDLFREEMDSKRTLTTEEQQRLKTSLANIRQLLKDVDLFRQLSPEKIRAYARAHIALGEFAEAEDILRRGRYSAPDDPELLFHLAHVLIALKRFDEAVRFLTFLEHLPSARALTLKLLGYAYLFIPGKLDASEDASRRYLCFDPSDTGARLNLACVHGQRGPANPQNREMMFQLLAEVVREAPGAVDQIRSLTAPGQDFEAWKEDPQFKALLETVAPPKSDK